MTRGLAAGVMAACVVTAPGTVGAQEYDPDMLGTFSIIARDAATGEIGMGVQSKAFGAGNRAVAVKGGVELNPTARQTLQRNQNLESVHNTPEFRKIVGG